MASRVDVGGGAATAAHDGTHTHEQTSACDARRRTRRETRQPRATMSGPIGGTLVPERARRRGVLEHLDGQIHRVRDRDVRDLA